MLVKTQAIVIHSLRYGEADLIVKCFTQSSGVKSYLLRNILKAKKAKLKASMFQPFMQLEVEANHKNKGTLENIREAKLIHANQSIYANVFKSSIVLFLAEVVRSCIQEEEQNDRLFQFLDEAINWLNQHEKFSNFHLLFLVKLSEYLGFSPNDTAIEAPYFNLLDGDFQYEETNKYCISNENSELLKQLLHINFTEAHTLKLNQLRRNNFLNMFLLYYELHIHGFKKPKSLDILQNLF